MCYANTTNKKNQQSIGMLILCVAAVLITVNQPAGQTKKKKLSRLREKSCNRSTPLASSALCQLQATRIYAAGSP
jgi:hypothetical protein